MTSTKRNVLGVMVDAVDYDDAVRRVIAAATEGRACSVSALAVHGVMTGVTDARQRSRLNDLDLVVPDGQPVRWALNGLHGAGLADQVRGTTLTLKVLDQAARDALPVYVYGSTPSVLARLQTRLADLMPELEIAGLEASRFGTLDAREQDELATRIRASGARLVLVGLGCPRQEVFVHAMRPRLGMPALAVGAAFDYLAGGLKPPPEVLRKHGLEWAWRLALEPRRLWRRYVLLNPAYLGLLLLQATGAWRPSPVGRRPPVDGPIDG